MATSAFFADVVLLVDESGSMKNEHAWLSSAFISLENSFLGAGVGPNQYALIGFGRRVDSAPILHTDLTDIRGLNGKLTSLIVDGNVEDGYAAIDFALDNISFRSGSQRFIILITDEDRDVTNASITKTSIFNDMVSNATQLNAIVNATFTNGALGVNAEGVGYFNDGKGNLVETPGNSVVAGFGATVSTYVTLAWSLGGSVFDLNILRKSGADVSVFTKAFTRAKTKEAVSGGEPTEEFCLFNVNPNETTFLCESDVAPNAFIPITSADEGQESAFTSSDFLEFVNELGPVEKSAMHVRLSIFTNPKRDALLYSAFSLSDQKRWFLKTNGSFCALGPNGAALLRTGIPDIIYAPEVLPASLIEQQMEHEILDDVTERPLVCGITYYTTIEAYIVDTFHKIKDSSFRFDCVDIKQDFWRDNLDEKNWTCSGQGQDDLRVSQSSNQALFPSVSANVHGNFAIAWQDFRENKGGDLAQVPDLFYGIWQSASNGFWFSGQGHADTRAIKDVFRPLVITDPAANFIFSGMSDQRITINKCPQPTPAVVTPLNCVFSDDEIFDIDNTNRDAEQYLKARIYEPDVVSSFAMTDEKVVSVVDDCFTRLDVIGAPGTYAFRARNEDDSDWSSWINIDGRLPSGASSSESRENISDGDAEEKEISAYYIDKDRFIAPWVLSAGNGIKRVCLQILTYFGISKVFCLDVMANVAQLEYKVEFFYDAAFTEKADEYKGLSVIQHRVTTETDDQGSNGGGSRVAGTTTIYIRVTFADYLDNNEFTFNFIQQGINDQYALDLTKSQEGVYTGSFNIQNSDGFFNKDGLSAIVVNVPDPCTKLRDVICSGNQADLLNPNLANVVEDFKVAYSGLKSIDADSVYKRLKTSKLSHLTNVDSFKQLYSVDDPRFTFGNPKFFIQK
tara:strand:+ start:2489 stop:5209 length:2721 start_codon:yes stop_codon:yes gene_type:complete